MPRIGGKSIRLIVARGFMDDLARTRFFCLSQTRKVDMTREPKNNPLLRGSDIASCEKCWLVSLFHLQVSVAYALQSPWKEQSSKLWRLCIFIGMANYGAIVQDASHVQAYLSGTSCQPPILHFSCVLNIRSRTPPRVYAR